MLQKRIIPVVAALMAVFAVWFAAHAAADENDQWDGQMRYIILIDTSQELDPGEVCASACDLVLDVLPEQNAQIGVIAYGYTGHEEDEYSYTNEARPSLETEYIHQLLPLGQVGTVDEQLLHERILQAFRSDQRSSPHGQALLAGVDMLAAAGTPEGKGCIIWISDGIQSSEEWETERKCRERAVAAAVQNQWPIHAVQLNYGDAEEAKRLAAEKMLKEIAEQTCSGENDVQHYQKVEMHKVLEGELRDRTHFRKLQRAVLEILPGTIRAPEPEDHKVTAVCDVQDLTYEYVVAFLGTGLDAVSVEAPEAEPCVYTESRDDGDIAVERGEDCFVVRLRFPVPEQWTIHAYGASEKVCVYRSIHRGVQIDLVVEDELNRTLPTGDADNMELDRMGKLHFVSSYTYGDRPLDISQTGGSITAKVEIQAKRPGDNSLYRKLDSIEMEWDGQCHRTDGIPLSELAEKESERYGEQMRIYRARIVLEWEDDGLQQQYGEWFSFGLQNDLSEITGEGSVSVSVIANGLIHIPLKEHIRNDDGDPLKYELGTKAGPADNFVLADQEGNPLGETVEGVLDDVWIKASSYVGEYDLVLLVWDGEVRHRIEIHAVVTPYPENVTEPPPVIQVEMNDVPTPLRWMRFLVGLEKNTGEHHVPMDANVLDVTVMGKDAEKVIWSYDAENRDLRIQPTVEGPVDLELQVQYDAFEPAENGTYKHQEVTRPLKLNAVSQFTELKDRGGRGLALLGGASLVLALVYLVLVSLRKFPEDMICTMKLLAPKEENGQEAVSCVLARPLRDFRSAKRHTLDGFRENKRGISIEELLRGLIDHGEKTEETGNLPGKVQVQEWFNNHNDSLNWKRLEQVRLKGTRPPGKAYFITGLRGKDDAVRASISDQGSYRGTEISRPGKKVPATQKLVITLKLKELREMKVAEEEKKVEKIEICVQKKRG